MAVSKKQIIAACEALLKDNDKAPNQSQVRDLLGGGSFSTIAPVLAEWKKERTETKLQPNNSTAPDGVKDVAEAAINKIWQVAERLAEERLASEREALKTAQDETTNKITDLEQFISSLENDLQASEKSLKDLLSENSELKKETEEDKATIAELTIEKSSLVVKLEDFESLKNENSEMTKVLIEKEKSLAIITSEHESKDKQISRMENQFKELTEKTKEEIKILNNKLTAEESNAKNTNSNLENTSKLLGKAENKIATLEERTKRIDTLEKQVEKMTAETIEVKSELKSTLKALGTATKKQTE